MTIKQTLYWILILFSISSCERNQISNEKILSDIFPQLIDSLYIKWNPIPPPPHRSIYDKDSNIIGIDSMQLKFDLAAYQKFLNRFDSLDSRTMIGIKDSCFLIDWNDLKSRNYSEDIQIKRILELSNSKSKESNKLNLNQIDIPNDFKLISESEITKNYPWIWKNSKYYKIAGKLETSKIYLTTNKKFGILQVNYRCEYWCGYGYYILIEKTNEKWYVKRILPMWVS
ncbi:MAG: hypothetical protein R2852_04395 [Bacteroidia bacterium]